ncbi:hypothetical protein BGZ59_009415 [Podila verticillata]|nr:hypothetical protein BGZ59_009415 [Podila verticillata]
MKFTVSAVVLALAATQVQAIVPIPVETCTQLVFITPADTSCVDFAAKFGITFAQLRAMNQHLDASCNNLDAGHNICVSITGPKLGVLTSIPPYPSQTSATVSAPLTTITSSSVGLPPKSTTTGASVPVTTSTATSSVPATSVTSATPKTTTPASAASSSKASLVLGAAGVLLSVAYML